LEILADLVEPFVRFPLALAATKESIDAEIVSRTDFTSSVKVLSDCASRGNLIV
jgi:hypothetical protein